MNTNRGAYTDPTIENLFKQITIIKNCIENLEKRIIKIEYTLSELKIPTKNNEERITLVGSKSLGENIVTNQCNITDFINYYKLEKLGYDFFSAKDIDNENEKINRIIEEKVYDDFLPNHENQKNKKVGEFLYSIGGISRIAQNIANDIFLELFEYYKNYLEGCKTYIWFNPEIDRKNFSIWVKKCIHKNYYECISSKNSKKIEKYLPKDKETKIFLLKIYQNLISIYLKCRLSFPIVDCYYSSETKFDYKTMIDIIDKSGKSKKVNFCYLPELKSNGKTLSSGKLLVFTYIKDKTYQKVVDEGKIFEEFENTIKNPQLYKIPFKENFNYEIQNDKLKVVSPIIPREVNPEYKLNIMYGNSTIKSFKSKEGSFTLLANEIINYNFQIEIYIYNNLVLQSQMFNHN